MSAQHIHNTVIQEQLNVPESSAKLGRDLIDQFKEPLSKQRILSYLTTPVLGSLSPSDLYEQLKKETVTFKEHGIPPVVRLELSPIVEDKFISLQKWEGVVIEVMKDYFLAKLNDLTIKGPDEEAEFPIEEISEEDRKLIKPGAVFYWNIGYHDSHRGQRTRVSIMRFRRLPAWRKEEIEASKHEARCIKETIEWK